MIWIPIGVDGGDPPEPPTVLDDIKLFGTLIFIIVLLIFITAKCTDVENVKNHRIEHLMEVK